MVASIVSQGTLVSVVRGFQMVRDNAVSFSEYSVRSVRASGFQALFFEPISAQSWFSAVRHFCGVPIGCFSGSGNITNRPRPTRENLAALRGSVSGRAARLNCYIALKNEALKIRGVE